MSHNIKHYKSFADLIRDISYIYKGRVALSIRRRVIKEKIYYEDIPVLTSRIKKYVARQTKKGDRVLVWGMNSPEYALLLLALLSSDLVVVPLDYRTSVDVAKKIIKQTRPRVAFVSRLLDASFMKGNVHAMCPLESLLVDSKTASLREVRKIYPHKSDQMCEIVYTSGTTGTPKGVMLSPKNLLDNTYVLGKRLPTLRKYRSISILPLSHMFEQIVGLTLGLSLGSDITYLSQVNSFKIQQALQEVKPTYVLLVPQMLKIFLERIYTQASEAGKKEKLMKLLRVASRLPLALRRLLFYKVHKAFGGSIEFIGCGGAPLNREVAESFLYMGFKILEGYGATEVTAAACFNSDPHNLGNVGKPLEGVHITLDEDSQIIIKSTCVARGYYKNIKRTRMVFTPKGYHTGDIGTFDESGNLRIMGRDVFKIVTEGGEKIYVEDLEQKIQLHPLVQDACVVGVQKGNADSIFAVLILKKGVSKSRRKSIIREVNTQLESKQQITQSALWPEEDFPRTHTLKIDRYFVKDYITKSASVQKQIVIPDRTKQAFTDVLDLIAKISGCEKKKIRDADVLTTDLGFDSLDRGELIALIEEHLYVSLENAQIHAQTTVSDIKKLIKKSAESTTRPSFPSWQFTPWGEVLRYIVVYFIIFPLHALSVRIRILTPGGINKLALGHIVIFNHVGLFDALTIMRLMGKNAHRIITPGYSGMWKSPFASKALEIVAGGVPLDQSGKSLIPLLQFISDRMDEGRILLFAPQGRHQKKGAHDPFKVGIGYFAQELRLPVVPVKLMGYEEIYPAPITDASHLSLREYFPRKIGTVRIKIGTPLDPKKVGSPIEFAHLLEEEFEKL